MMQGWLVKDEKPDVKSEVEDENRDVKSDVKLEAEDGVKEEPLVEVKPKPKGRTLVVMGTYSIGKERIVKGRLESACGTDVLAVAKALGSTIYCDPRKKGILLCETDPELHAMLSSDPIEVGGRFSQTGWAPIVICLADCQSQVHLLPLGNIQLDRLQEYLVRLHPHFDRALGFRPTGWSYSPPAGTDMLPDVNMVIKRDQSRTFTWQGLQPQRGSCRQYMMYGECEVDYCILRLNRILEVWVKANHQGFPIPNIHPFSN